MPGNVPEDPPWPAEPDRPAAETDVLVLPIHAEGIIVSRRQIEKALVRAARTTHLSEQAVQEEVTHEHVEVRRIPMDRIVTAVPPTRQEGDTTILSVVEEVVVVERRLVLREEVHFRRIRKTETHSETVSLRKQSVTVTRTDLQSGNQTEIPIELNSAYNLKDHVHE